jgi:hypothetical protein
VCYHVNNWNLACGNRVGEDKKEIK